MLYIIDPHCINILNNVNNIILGRSKFQKLNYFVSLFEQSEAIPVFFGGSSFPTHKLKSKLVMKIVAKCEFKLWKRLNNIDVENIDISNIPIGSTVFVDTNVASSFNEELIDIFNERNIRVLAYVSHLAQNSDQKIKMFKKLTCEYRLISEAKMNLSGVDKTRMRVLPYYFHERFKAEEVGDQRLAKLLVVGTVNFKKDQSLLNNFGSNVLNPLRNELYLHRNQITEFFNIAQDYSLTNNQYYNLDLPKLYSLFKYFVCPEDITGTPSSNMVEGMAAGSIYFGNENLDYFSDYGMEPFTHFVPYDGTREGLVEVFQTIKYDTVLTREIAENSIKLAKESFSRKALLSRVSALVGEVNS